jgi:hypothetical protein
LPVRARTTPDRFFHERLGATGGETSRDNDLVKRVFGRAGS